MNGHEEHEKENGERWLLTYADLITLLLAFFIIMFAMSNLDKNKYKAVIHSLGSAFGAVPSEGDGAGAGGDLSFPLFSPGSSMPPGNSNTPSLSTATASQSATPAASPMVSSSPPGGGIGNAIEIEEMENVQDQVRGLLSQEHLDNDVSVTMRARGLVISINSRVLFASGKADLTSASKTLVLRIAEVLAPLSGNQILVEGHTDTDPIHTVQFPSNWDLSAARASTVLRLLLSTGKLKEANMSAVGYGEFRPIAPNNTPANKAKNRRVNIVILKDDYDKSIDIVSDD